MDWFSHLQLRQQKPLATPTMKDFQKDFLNLIVCLVNFYLVVLSFLNSSSNSREYATHILKLAFLHGNNVFAGFSPKSHEVDVVRELCTNT